MGDRPVSEYVLTQRYFDMKLRVAAEEDFTGVAGQSYEAAPVDVGDFSVSMTGDDFGFISHNAGPASTSNDVTGTARIKAATGDVRFTSLLLVKTAGDADGFAIDNVVYSAATRDVPEPARSVLVH